MAPRGHTIRRVVDSYKFPAAQLPSLTCGARSVPWQEEPVWAPLTKRLALYAWRFAGNRRRDDSRPTAPGS